MGKSIYYLLLMVLALSACNNTRSGNNQKTGNSQDTQAENLPVGEVPVFKSASTVSIKEIINSYLQLKNALADDNSSAAAEGGTLLGSEFKNFDKSVLSEDQKKAFEDVETDVLENSQHIAANKGDMDHQREHFEMLSNDIYDLVKEFNSGKLLYRDFCPMYNDGKGAFWLSETKEIHNPYYGKEMPTCGVVREKLE